MTYIPEAHINSENFGDFFEDENGCEISDGHGFVAVNLHPCIDRSSLSGIQ